MSNKNIPLSIKFTNVRGLGFFSKGKLNLSKVPFKIKELTCSANYVPSIFVCLETKLKSSHREIKLPKGCVYGGETSGNEPKAGIFVYHDNVFKIMETRTIISTHCMYLKYKIGDSIFHLIPTYLPSCSTLELKDMLNRIATFIKDHNLTAFTFFGDFNIDFNNPGHFYRAKLLHDFLVRHNMINLANKLSVNPIFTWRGSGQRFNSKSNIDYFFCNFDYFNHIEFRFNSFSDHKTVTVAKKSKFKYKNPTWKPFLFKDKNFLDIMKTETEWFLKKNSDDKNINLANVSVDDLSFLNAKNQYTGTMFNLIQHLKQKHDVFYSKLRHKEFQKTKDFDSQINMLYNKIETSPDKDSLQSIQDIIQTQQEYFKNLVSSRAEIYYMRYLLLDGKPNYLTYQNMKPKKKNSYNLLIDNEMTDCPEKIVNKLGKIHAASVCPDDIPKADLNGLLETFNLKLDDIFPKIQNTISPYSSTKEFLKVIKSLKDRSSPGPTSQPKSLFMFLFQNVPKFATNAFNQMYDMDLDNSDFSFIKIKNVCFLPKKDLDSSNPDNLRPIYLSENSQKILDKALNNKIAPFMSKIVHSDQFGFIKKRHMATATISITAIMNYIKSKEIDSQLVFFDLKKAYDQTLYEVSDKILNHIFSPQFAKVWASISNGGKFRVVVNNHISKQYEIKLGFPQGAPSSANKFVIYNHLFYSCLNSKLMSHLMLKIKKHNLPAIFFADDGFKALTLKTEKDMTSLSDLLKKLKSTVNIEINFKKTKILTYGNCPVNLSSLGTPCNIVKHLGVYLSFDFATSLNLTYKELLNKLNNRSKNMHFNHGTNIFKRRNLCLSFMNSCALHIYRIYSPNNVICKKIWKSTSKFLWSNGSSHRYKVAKKRIESEFHDGGLNMLLPEQQSFSIWITSFFNILKHANEYPNSNLAIILKQKHVPISSILKNFGSNMLKKYSNKFMSLYPPQGKTMFKKSKIFLEELEKNPKTFLQSPITSSYWSKDIKFSSRESIILDRCNLKTIASILKSITIQQKYLYIPVIKENLIENLDNHQEIYAKLKEVVINISNEFEFSSLQCLSLNKNKNAEKPLFYLTYETPSIFSLFFKQMHKKKIASIHPSIETRKVDKKWFPDIESFQNSFKIVLDLPITLYYKGFLFEQYIRTLVSCTKLFKWNLIDSDICTKCYVKNDSDHAIFFCKFPKYFAHCLAIFLDEIYFQGRPEFIFLKENFFLFNIYYECFKGDDFAQISMLILAAKDKALKISKEPCLSRWNENNYFSQTLLLAQFCSKLLDKGGISTYLIEKFINFVLKYKDNTKYFSI
jgi:hypothetical protein